MSGKESVPESLLARTRNAGSHPVCIWNGYWIEDVHVCQLCYDRRRQDMRDRVERPEPFMDCDLKNCCCRIS